jgi:high affinity Mn2+ porin
MYYKTLSGNSIFRYLITKGIVLVLLSSPLKAQKGSDTINTTQNWNFHFQNTEVGQYHPAFHAKYSGMNSLKPNSETAVSVTSTLFFGAKLFKNTRIYFNPEFSGGSGFSKTTGVAGFPNGEVYRVSDPAPNVYIARFYIEQIFPLSDEYEYIKDDLNQLACKKPSSYVAILAGKYSIMDFFDCNKYSHDPRTQFYNWALMGNGAWDYPANTRGYTFGLTVELVKPQWALRFSTVMLPTTANGSVMDLNVKRSGSESMEFEHKYFIGNQPGTIRLMSYLNEARMGNYRLALEQGVIRSRPPSVDSVHGIGRTKYGYGINIEQEIAKNIGMFFRSGWNDGHNETWVFTEIDRHLSAGLVFAGTLWTRKDDILGIAQVINGLSKDHKDYLNAGGYGFIIGDGKLNYRPEFITEFYYSFKIHDNPFWITPDYQFIINPAYNKDRGPVHAFGLRAHCEF